MTYTRVTSICRKLTATAAIVAASASAACSANSSSGAAPFAGEQAAKRTATFTWNYSHVTASSGNPTWVTGINNLTGSNNEIVGYYQASHASTSSKGRYYSFISSGTSTSKGLTYSSFSPASYPIVGNGGKASIGSQMNAIAPESSGSTPILAGFVNRPGDQCGGWPVVDNQGLWALEYRGNVSAHNTQAGWLQGVNDAGITVGYDLLVQNCTLTPNSTAAKPAAVYWGEDGTKPSNVPFPTTSSWLNPTSSVANGVDDDGDMVGTVTVGGTTYSWYAICTKYTAGKADCSTTSSSSTDAPKSSDYCWYKFNGGNNPVATGISSESGTTATNGDSTKLVVGYRIDGSGKATHGFLLPVTTAGTGTSETCVAGNFEDIQAQGAEHGTWVLGVNSLGYIVGYDINGSNNQVGFVGIPTTAAALPKRTLERK